MQWKPQKELRSTSKKAGGATFWVVSDLKVRFTDNGTLVYTADVISYSDYSPYGTLLDSRHGNDNTYRYGFNGMERDDEVKASGNSYDFGARVYDPRLGRWLSMDALSGKKPYLSPYQSLANNPIIFIDPDGNDEWYFYADGTWSFKKTEGAANFYTVDADGVKNDLLSVGNYMYSWIPGVDTPDEDLAEELMARPLANALFGVLYPEHKHEPFMLMWNKTWMVPVDIVTALISLPGMIKGAYKGGKAIFTFFRAGKTMEATMDTKGIVTYGKKIYSAEGFTNFMNGVKNSFKSLGYRIKSMQKGALSRDIVNQKKTKMLTDEAFDFAAKENRIGGYYNTKTGQYIINDGNHRFQAAIEIFEETGDSKFVDKLIKNGNWESVTKNPVDATTFPKVK